MSISMEGQPAQIDFTDPFVRLFKEPDGRKALAIGSVCWLGFFLLFPPLLAVGWGVAYARHVAEGRPDLPDWQMGRIADGFRIVGIYLVYFLPMLLIFVPAFALMAFSEMTPAEGGPVQVFAGGGMMLWFGLGQLYGIAVSLVMPAAIAAFVGTGQWASAFSPSVIKQVIAPHGWLYVGVAALVYAIGYVAGFGIFLCFIGVFFTVFYSATVGAHFSGQLARGLRLQAPWPPPVA